MVGPFVLIHYNAGIKNNNGKKKPHFCHLCKRNTFLLNKRHNFYVQKHHMKSVCVFQKGRGGMLTEELYSIQNAVFIDK